MKSRMRQRHIRSDLGRPFLFFASLTFKRRHAQPSQKENVSKLTSLSCSTASDNQRFYCIFAERAQYTMPCATSVDDTPISGGQLAGRPVCAVAMHTAT